MTLHAPLVTAATFPHAHSHLALDHHALVLDTYKSSDTNPSSNAPPASTTNMSSLVHPRSQPSQQVASGECLQCAPPPRRKYRDPLVDLTRPIHFIRTIIPGDLFVCNSTKTRSTFDARCGIQFPTFWSGREMLLNRCLEAIACRPRRPLREHLRHPGNANRQPT